jgi:4-hydroxyacetophenone monooxygenase
MPISSADPRSITMTASDQELREALAEANLPTLLPVLAQLTSDSRWLKEPYVPTRTVALNDTDTGGFTEVVQAEIRAAAFEIVRSWRDGGQMTPPPPSDDEITGMLSVSLGEQVPPEYGVTMAEEAGFHDREPVAWGADRPGAADRYQVVIIGAGLSGVAAGATLRKLGIPFVILEKNPAVGGVWWENDYPGSGVDTATSMYSYSFEPRRAWNRYYAKQPEILAYVQSVARKCGVEDAIRFQTCVQSARWDEGAQKWTLQVSRHDGETELLAANAVISCVGILNQPAIPNFDGMDKFQGPMFHSARWDHSVTLEGKRVAVIGTGATSMQIVPAIADQTAKVLVFQRSPQWVAPNLNYLRQMSNGVQLLMDQLPYYAAFYRLRLIWMAQDKLLATLYRDPDWPHQDRSINAQNDKHRIFFTKHVDSELGDRIDLRDKVLPDYPPYGKRILMDNNWIRTVKRDDVELIDSAVAGFDEHHVVTANGDRHEADVAVLATGFYSRRMLWPMEVHGRSGTTVRDQWGDDDASAYLGIVVPDLPNFFLVGGPHTALAHGGSAVYVAECAIAYIAQLLIHEIEQGIGSLEVRQDVCADFNKRVDEEHSRLIWTHPGMSNWYRNAAGRVVSAIPFRAVDYWAMTRTPNFDDYVARPLGDAEKSRRDAPKNRAGSVA